MIYHDLLNINLLRMMADPKWDEVRKIYPSVYFGRPSFLFDQQKILEYAVHNDYLSLVNFMIDPEEGPYGAPIKRASELGYLDIVDRLLEDPGENGN